jgi:SpoIIAA-like
MIEFILDEQNSILILKPQSALTAEDFLQLAQTLDPYLEKVGSLKGLIIETQHFPGWKNLDGFKAHLKFVKGHHEKINKIALVTDSPFAAIGKMIGGLFLKPEVKQFAYGQTELAKAWISQ